MTARDDVARDLATLARIREKDRAAEIVQIDAEAEGELHMRAAQLEASRYTAAELDASARAGNRRVDRGHARRVA